MRSKAGLVDSWLVVYGKNPLKIKQLYKYCSKDLWPNGQDKPHLSKASFTTFKVGGLFGLIACSSL